MAKRIPFGGDERSRKSLQKAAALRVAAYEKVIAMDTKMSAWARQGQRLVAGVVAELEALGGDTSVEATAYLRLTGKAPRGLRVVGAELEFLRRLRTTLDVLAVHCPRYPGIDARDAVDEGLRVEGYSREEIATMLNENIEALDQRRKRHAKKPLPKGAHGFSARRRARTE